MTKKSERTLGSRIANAEALATHLTTFTTYVAVRPEDSVVNYKAFIAVLKTLNSTVATNQTSYSNAVENRLKLFTKNPDSLLKTLAPIASHVKAKFGKLSKEVKDLTALIKKIRGESSAKLKKNEEGEFVSQSERSYGSQILKFQEIIAKLTQFGTDYTPTNIKIKLPALNTQSTVLTAANNQVTTTFGQLKPSKDNRAIQYLDLTDRSQRIKDAVKSQFGVISSEYKLIKGLKI